nr:MAG TPA: hypothetical protein [Caudoviricetes sp.]
MLPKVNIRAPITKFDLVMIDSFSWYASFQ